VKKSPKIAEKDKKNRQKREELFKSSQNKAKWVV
jgi:hypothetical protein